MKTLSLVLASLALSHCPSHINAATPTFEVASIKPCAPGTSPQHPGTENWVLPGGRFEAKAARISDLFEWAYRVQPVLHSPVPAPLTRQLFDIVAQAGRDATEAEMRLMVRSLLADRFHFQFHMEKKELPVYVWTMSKPPAGLMPSQPGTPKSVSQARLPGDSKFPTMRAQITGLTLGDLAGVLSMMFERPILDRTGLEGTFDFTLDLTPTEASPNLSDPSILITALSEQLNLKMVADKAVIDWYAIDTVEAPTAD